MEIISAKYIISSATYKQCPVADRPEYAFIGRSNVGKSSLINMLTNQRQLAKISATPGKTQLINHFEIVSKHFSPPSGKAKGLRLQPSPLSGEGKGMSWYIVDLPGYGYATVSLKSRNNWENMIGSYIRKRENLVCLFVLIDSRHEPQKADLEFIAKLGEWQTPFVLVFTKTDKNKPGATARNADAFLKAMSEQWEKPPPYFLTSASKKTGRQEVLDYIGGLNAGFTKL
ncbi:MAG: GTP-binding protein [Bacteroidota bacterium]